MNRVGFVELFRMFTYPACVNFGLYSGPIDSNQPSDPVMCWVFKAGAHEFLHLFHHPITVSPTMSSSDPGTDSDNKHPRIPWVEEEHEIMAEKLETFRAKDRTKEQRRKIVQKVCKAIKLFNSGLSDAEWILKKKVRLN